MPARTQTPKRPAAGRFGRPAGKPAQRPARGRRVALARTAPLVWPCSGAAGLLMKYREKLTAVIRHGDSSGEAVKAVVAQAGPVASNCGPVAAAAVTDLLGFPEHPAG